MRGIGKTSIAQVMAAITQLIVVIVYSRNLGSEEVGIVAVLLMIQGVGFILADSGITNYIIQKRNLTTDEQSSIYLINLIIGLSIFAVIYFSTEAIGRFYASDAIEIPLKILATSYLFLPITIQYQAYLIKNQDFGALALAEIVSRVFSLTLFFLCIKLKAGIYSVVAFLFFSSALKALILLLKGRKYYRPTLSFNLRSLQDLFNFSKFQLSSTLINVSTLNLDVFIVGKVLGLDTLGGYSLAKELVFRTYSLVNGTIMKVAFPAMAKFTASGTDQISQYQRTCELSILANLPIFLFIALASDELIHIFFGQKYGSFSPVLALLSVIYLFKSFITPRTVLAIANGRPDLELRWNVISLVFQIGLFSIGLTFDIKVACQFLLASQLTLFAFSHFMLTKPFFNAPISKPFVSKRWEILSLVAAAGTIFIYKAFFFEASILPASIWPDVPASLLLTAPYLIIYAAVLMRNREFIQA